MKIKSTPISLGLIFILFGFFSSCKKDDSCEAASTANAGVDQNVLASSTSLAANTPESGSGSWSIVSGGNGTLTDALNPATSFSGTFGNTYVLKWSITGCPASEDEVQISFCNPANSANAGPDQIIVGTSTALAASGIGTWSIISGSGGSIATATSATSSFSGVVGNTYVLRWSVACPATQDDVQIKFINTDPLLVSVDKTSVINGEIITVTGFNFSSNYQGGSQIVPLKTANPDMNSEVFLSIISRTATQIQAVMTGTGGGTAGVYQLRYSKKPDANAGTFFPSNLSVEVVAGAPGQFFTSSTFTATNLSPGSEASFGVKNGSTTIGDYTVKLLQYNYTTGALTEYSAPITSITPSGYGGTMDKIAFTLPANLPVNAYYVKVTYGGKTLIGGWGQSLNVF
jgi:hypothetical protein